MNQTPTPKQLAANVLAAISSLRPDAPIYAAEIGADGSITLILPSKQLVYSPALREGDQGGGDDAPSSAPDDFTAIPYVGKEIALALNNAGYTTFEDLIKADDTALLDLPQIGPFALRKIREYLQKHYL